MKNHYCNTKKIAFLKFIKMFMNNYCDAECNNKILKKATLNNVSVSTEFLFWSKHSGRQMVLNFSVTLSRTAVPHKIVALKRLAFWRGISVLARRRIMVHSSHFDCIPHDCTLATQQWPTGWSLPSDRKSNALHSISHASFKWRLLGVQKKKYSSLTILRAILFIEFNMLKLVCKTCLLYTSRCV